MQKKNLLENIRIVSSSLIRKQSEILSTTQNLDKFLFDQSLTIIFDRDLFLKIKNLTLIFHSDGFAELGIREN